MLATVCVAIAVVAGVSLAARKSRDKSPLPPAAIHGDLISATPTNSSPPSAPLAQSTPAGINPGVPATPTPVAAYPGPRPTLAVAMLPADSPTPRDGYAPTGFDKLAAFQIRVFYKMTNAVTFASTPVLSGTIPDRIKSYDGQSVAVQGYMLPTKLADGKVTDFLLMRNRMFCCFGKPLALNEWVCVRMTDKGIQSIMDQPVTIYGKLHVGEIKENGQISGIYRLDGDHMAGPEIAQ
jgi:hypothetical protein